MPIVIRGGKLLLVGGKICLNEDCCCGEVAGPCIVCANGTTPLGWKLVVTNSTGEWSGFDAEYTINQGRDGECFNVSLSENCEYEKCYPYTLPDDGKRLLGFYIGLHDTYYLLFRIGWWVGNHPYASSVTKQQDFDTTPNIPDCQYDFNRSFSMSVYNLSPPYNLRASADFDLEAIM
jgi:hypothetical protein